MKVLVTGCAGFIGSNLIDRLLKQHTVIGVDDLSTGLLHNMAGAKKNRSFEFRQMSVLDPAFLSFSEVDVIVHLAAKKIPKYGDRLSTLANNVHMTENVLELARKCDAKVVTASTSDVYGKNKVFSEDTDSLIGPTYYARWAYAISKIFDEHLCYAYQETYKVPFTILRYFNCYGPRQNLSWLGGPQSLFISAALRGEECIVHGDGSQTRAFTYVSDVIDGTILAMKTPKAENEVFNIGNDKTEVSIIDLANLIYELAAPNSTPRITKVPHEALFGKYDEIYQRRCDIAKAKRLLHFKPRVGLREGLTKTIEWQKNILVIPSGWHIVGMKGKGEWE